MLKCKITKLADTIWPVVYANIPLIIYGPTGVGKSTVIRNELVPKIENEFGPTVFHDTRLSTKDIVDGTGMPVIDKDQMATLWTRPAFIPFDDGKMHVFLYDEFGHASVQLQQMAYSLVLDRALGGYPFPKKNRLILATNTRTDGGGDNKMLKPLENRLAHYTVETDAPGLIEKMKVWGWDSRLVAFLTLRPGEIHNVSQTDPSFPTPRSLERLNEVLKSLPVDVKNNVIENASLAIVGEGFTRQFMTFLTNLGANLPKLSEILANPSKARVSADPHFQYVVASAISKNVDVKTASKFAEYLARLMPDIRSMAAHEAIARDMSLKDVKDITSLIMEGSAAA
jgi:DNA polymerase III delta prime subunit